MSLEASASLQPGLSELLNDLATAYLVRFEQTQAEPDLLRALDAVERAVEANPRLSESRWNQLLIGSLLSRPLALQLCAAEPPEGETPEWREEREQLCQSLEGPTVGASLATTSDLAYQLSGGDALRPEDSGPDLARRVEDELLPRWAATLVQGDIPSANRLAQNLVLLSEEVQQATGDSALACLPAALRKPAPSSESTKLAAGVVKLSEGIRLELSGACGSAISLFEAAEGSLGGICPSLRGLARFHRVRCLYRSGRGDPPTKLAELGLEDAEKNGWTRQEGLFAVASGTLRFGRGETSAALTYYLRALQSFSSIEDRVGESYAHQRLAAAYGELGESRLAWRHRMLALRAIQFREDQKEYVEALAEAAYGAQGLGLSRAASRLAWAELEAAPRLENPIYLQLAIRHQADFQTDLADSPTTREILRAGREVLERVEDANEGSGLRQYFDVVEARALRATQPEKALALLDSALRQLRHSTDNLLILKTLRERARVRQQLGRLSEAVEDLESGLEIIESLRADRRQNYQRLALLSSLREFTQARLQLEAQAGASGEKLLAIEERGRARLTVDWLSRPLDQGPISPGEPIPNNQPEGVLSNLDWVPPSTAVVEYSWLDGTLFIWVATKDGIRFLDMSLPEGGAAWTTREGLYDVLIRPILPWLESRDALYLAPDSRLSEVPFSALRARQSRRFLAQDFHLAVVPSLGVLHALLGRPLEKEPARRTFLAVANPRFSRTSHPSLAPLPGGAAEATHLADLFPGSEILTHQRATRAAVLARLHSHWGLHFATHGVMPDGSAIDARLILAEAGPGALDADLYAEDLLSVDSRTTRLVFLAACDSGRSTWSEVAPGLAWPLLAAGVPQVIATVAPIEDSVASELSQGFYSRLAAGDGVATSLRAEQLACLEAAGDGQAQIERCGLMQLYGLMDQPNHH